MRLCKLQFTSRGRDQTYQLLCYRSSSNNSFKSWLEVLHIPTKPSSSNTCLDKISCAGQAFQPAPPSCCPPGSFKSSISKWTIFTLSNITRHHILGCSKFLDGKFWIYCSRKHGVLSSTRLCEVVPELTFASPFSGGVQSPHRLVILAHQDSSIANHDFIKETTLHTDAM